MTSTNGSDETNQTTGVSVTNMNIAKNLLEKVSELLDAEVKYILCCDKKTQHKKIVIEYDHSSNLQ